MGMYGKDSERRIESAETFLKPEIKENGRKPAEGSQAESVDKVNDWLKCKTPPPSLGSIRSSDSNIIRFSFSARTVDRPTNGILRTNIFSEKFDLIQVSQ